MLPYLPPPAFPYYYLVTQAGHKKANDHWTLESRLQDLHD